MFLMLNLVCEILRTCLLVYLAYQSTAWVCVCSFRYPGDGGGLLQR